MNCIICKREQEYSDKDGKYELVFDENGRCPFCQMHKVKVRKYQENNLVILETGHNVRRM